MQIPLEAAYRQACAALGEALVRERFLTAEVAALTERLAEAEPQEADTTSPASGTPAPRTPGGTP